MDDCYKASWYFEVVSEHPEAGTYSLSFLSKDDIGPSTLG